MNALTDPNRRLFAASAGALIAGVTFSSSAGGTRVLARSVLGGLHHEYSFGPMAGFTPP